MVAYGENVGAAGNPRSGFAKSPALHGYGDGAGLLDLGGWRRRLGRLDWKEALGQGLDERETTALRRSTMTGRPLGSDSFISKLETRLGRRLRALPVGRPRKRKRQHARTRKQKR